MNKQQYEVEKAKLSAEEKEIKQLKAIYGKATEDISKKIRIHNSKIDFLLKNYDQLNDADKSILQSQIYQRQFQENLKKQIDSFMKELEGGQYESISGYLKGCYETGYIGTMYDLAGQGIPLTMPIDQKKVARAMTHNTKLSTTLYKKLGEDVSRLKRTIASEISRGIATASSYSDIARNIANHSNAGFNRAMRIARTEGHRIQMEAAFDAQHEAQDAGADIVKQWNSALDGRTRPTHRKLDGQIRELDDPFEVEGMKVMYPSGFGKASEDINCRCTMLQRAKWALDEEELEILKKRAAKHGLIVKESQGKALSKEFGHVKAKDFADYNRNYLQMIHNMAAEGVYKNDWSKTKPLLVTNEQKKMLIRQARQANINILHLKEFDGDIELLKGQVDTLMEMKDKFPQKVGRITVEVSDRLTDDIYAKTIIRNNKVTIVFNNKALRNREITEENLRKAKRFAGVKIENIAVHEFGHIIAQRTGHKGLDVVKQAYYNVHNKTITDGEAVVYLRDNISQYSIISNYVVGYEDGTKREKKYKEIESEVLSKHNNSPDAFTIEFVKLLKELLL